MRGPRRAVERVELEGSHVASVHAIIELNKSTSFPANLGRLEREGADIWVIGAARFDVRVISRARGVIGARARRTARRPLYIQGPGMVLIV